jgi:hypothetical protein
VGRWWGGWGERASICGATTSSTGARCQWRGTCMLLPRAGGAREWIPSMRALPGLMGRGGAWGPGSPPRGGLRACPDGFRRRFGCADTPHVHARASRAPQAARLPRSGPHGLRQTHEANCRPGRSTRRPVRRAQSRQAGLVTVAAPAGPIDCGGRRRPSRADNRSARPPPHHGEQRRAHGPGSMPADECPARPSRLLEPCTTMIS